MATFIGFNTQEQYKKFTLVDGELVKRDLLNALNIWQGQLPGRPEYGTILWDFLFESQDQTTTNAIVQEIQRVCGGDPRIYLSDVSVYPQENGILLEVEIQIVPSEESQLLSIFFNQQTRRASYV